MILLSLGASLAFAASFECVQVTLTDPGTQIAVSGDLRWLRAVPTRISIAREGTGEVLVERNLPLIYNEYDGGYWLDNYDLNTWRVGRDAATTTSYYFLLDNGIIGTKFQAEVHEYFGPGGTWGWFQLEMDCEITSY